MEIDDLLRTAVERGASDLHLKAGNQLHLRIDGALVAISDMPRLTSEDTQRMASAIMGPRQKERLPQCSEVDMAYGVGGAGRFRVSIFQQRGSIGLVLRV